VQLIQKHILVVVIIGLKEKHNNYSIQKSRLSKFYIPIDQYDKDNNFIAHYNTIIDASKKYNCTNYELWEAVNGIRKTRCGYIWKQSNVA
jgi:hypothetical protein